MHLIPNIIIRSPGSEQEISEYYLLRWQILREPWGREKDSEKDDLENESIHRIAVLNEKIIAVGRVHFINEATAQIRYMAVNKDYTNNGVGSTILNSLETVAKEKKVNIIMLHAREEAVAFYKKHGYQTIKKSHLLYGEIQHFEMKKII